MLARVCCRCFFPSACVWLPFSPLTMPRAAYDIESRIFLLYFVRGRRAVKCRGQNMDRREHADGPIMTTTCIQRMLTSCVVRSCLCPCVLLLCCCYVSCPAVICPSPLSLHSQRGCVSSSANAESTAFYARVGRVHGAHCQRSTERRGAPQLGLSVV